MKKVSFYWLLISVYSFLAIGFGLGLSLAVRRLPDASQSQVQKEIWVYKDHPVTQTITPGHDGLNVLTVYLRNVALRNQEPFLFELSDSAGVIRSIQLTGYNIGDGDNVRFQFAPIPDSAGKTYTIKFSSDSPLSSAIGAGFSDLAHSIAYTSYYFPTNRLTVLKLTSKLFIGSLINPRFLVELGIIGTISYYLCRRLFELNSAR